VKIKLAVSTPLSQDALKAVARAKNYHGYQPHTELLFNHLIRYREDVATIIPAGTKFTLAALLPNPVPYRGVSIGEKAGGVPPLGTYDKNGLYSPYGDGVVTYVAFAHLYGANVAGDFGYWGGGVTGDLYIGDYLNHTQVSSTTLFNYECVWWDGTAIGYGHSDDGSHSAYHIVVDGAYNPGPALADIVSAATAAAVANYNAAYDAYVSANPDATKSWNLVCASNGEVLAQQEITLVGPDKYDTPLTTQWSGDGYVPMTHGHVLTFAVPEDCIYPVNATCPLSDPTIVTAWAAAQNALKARRKAWFRKNHDTVLADLKAGTLPKYWDYALKRYAPLSTHTSLAVPMTATYSDDVVESTNKTTTTRSVTLSYTIPVKQTDGTMKDENRTYSFSGTEVYDVVEYPSRGNISGDTILVNKYTYANWYAPNHVMPQTEGFWQPRQTHQYLNDVAVNNTTTPRFNAGLVWSGTVVQGKYWADSSLGYPPSYSFYATATVPPLPPFQALLAGSALEFVKKYINDVEVLYDAEAATAQASQLWLSSALMDGTTITIVPFGPVVDDVSLGMFTHDSITHSSDAAGATHIEVWGRAVFTYSRADGSFKFSEWVAPKDKDGNELPYVRVPVPAGDWPSATAYLKYSVKWADVKKDAADAAKTQDLWRDAVFSAI